VIYDDDDPWNQTAADNAEWLIRFKRDVGLAPGEDGPGLPPWNTPRPWKVEDGGSGFGPPYIKPREGQVFDMPGDEVPVSVDDRTYNVRKETAEQFLRDLAAGRYPKPASVFCSRDLENGLNAFVEECIRQGRIPSDDDLRNRASEILGVKRTAADDPKLLARFKAMHVLWQTSGESSEPITPGPQADFRLPNFATDVDMLAAFNQELGPTDLATACWADRGDSSYDYVMSAEEKGMMVDSEAQMEFNKIMGASAATSSPLRRKASQQHAANMGFTKPVGKGGGV
jgi:hypothetical protein